MDMARNHALEWAWWDTIMLVKQALLEFLTPVRLFVPRRKATQGPYATTLWLGHELNWIAESLEDLEEG